jgi:hypothetical protein
MTFPFSQMPPNAKVWIYASDKIISHEQLIIINEMAIPFIQNWTAHQNQLKAEFAVLYNCFLIFMVDEGFNEISGCGIDKSVNLVKDIEKQTNLNLFNRLKIQLINNNEVTIFNKTEIISAVKNRILSMLNTVTESLESERNAIQQETKSSAGDKYETQREMLQADIRRSEHQLDESKQHLDIK